MRLGAITACGLLLGMVAPGQMAHAAMRDIDFGRNTWLDRSGPAPFVLRQADGVITTSIDAGTPYAVWTVPGATRGEDALAIRIDPEHRPPDVSQKSKFEINVSRQDDVALDERFGHRFVLRSGSSNDLGFTFRMDAAAYDDPQRWVLHFQVWQCCSTATMPVLALQAVPGPGAPPGGVRFALIARDDDDLATHATSSAGHHLRFADGADTITLERGQPYRVVLHLSPDPGKRADGHMDSRTGEIAMGLDGREVLHYRGAWGYSGDPSKGVQSTYAVKLGIYRAAQPTRQLVYFSDIHWGADRAEVEAPHPQ